MWAVLSSLLGVKAIVVGGWRTAVGTWLTEWWTVRFRKSALTVDCLLYRAVGRRCMPLWELTVGQEFSFSQEIEGLDAFLLARRGVVEGAAGILLRALSKNK